MRFFALETDKDKIVDRFCHPGEEVVLLTYYHGLSFFFSSVREIFLTIVLFGIGIGTWIFGAPMIWVVPALALIWATFIFFGMVKAYIDWAYDFVFVTTDKVVFVDQTSIFKQEIMPIHMENIGGISTFTQFWNVFPFGGICIHLKEGRGGEDITKYYVPRADVVAGKISDMVTRYQRHNYNKEQFTTPEKKDTPVEPVAAVR